MTLPPRLGWIGYHEEGVLAFEAVLRKGYAMEVMITLASDSVDRAASTAYASLCRRYGVPFYPVQDINGDGRQLLARFQLEVAFVIGWPQSVQQPALNAVRLGMIGAHASLLPHNQGADPITWTLLRGEPQAGSSLVWLSETADRWELIDQCPIPVTAYDTFATLSAKVARANRDLILPLVPRLLRGERPGQPLPRSQEPILPAWPVRDGALEWSLPNVQVYDTVRALTRPASGAVGWLAGRRWRIWKIALLPSRNGSLGAPGEVIGAVVSPVESACGQVVVCGRGAVVLLEVEDDAGIILRGRKLSSESWAGRRWEPAVNHARL